VTTLSIESGQAEPNRRRLPIQVANETRMIRATIELVGEHDVESITSRMIAERSGTATNYISRYFGGRDALLTAAARSWGGGSPRRCARSRGSPGWRTR
jgi:AcrR family transcriptional regulator